MAKTISKKLTILGRQNGSFVDLLKVECSSSDLMCICDCVKAMLNSDTIDCLVIEKDFVQDISCPLVF